MRIGEGTITEILDGGLAKVRVNRDHLYVACSACFGAEHVYVTARNSLGAQEGQDVRYEVQDEHLVMGGFYLFYRPLVPGYTRRHRRLPPSARRFCRP